MSDEQNDGAVAVDEVEGEEGQKGAVKVKIKHESGESFELPYDFGSTLAEMVERYGEDVVYERALVGLTKQMRDKAYAMGKDSVKKDGTTVPADSIDTIRKFIAADWKPSIGKTSTPKDATAEFLKKFATMTAEEKVSFLATLKSME